MRRHGKVATTGVNDVRRQNLSENYDCDVISSSLIVAKQGTLLDDRADDYRSGQAVCVNPNHMLGMGKLKTLS